MSLIEESVQRRRYVLGIANGLPFVVLVAIVAAGFALALSASWLQKASGTVRRVDQAD